MKRLWMVFILLIVLALAACGEEKESGTKEEANKDISDLGDVVTLSLGHIASEDDAWHKGALKFAELVEEKTNGEVVVEVYPNSQLGNDRDLIEGMKMGSVDFALPAGVLSNFQPEYSLLELPFLFRDEDHLANVLYGDIGDELKANLLEDNGIRGLEFWMRGPRQLTSNREVRTLEDLDGLKIRVPEIPAFVDSWKAMGANPTPMAFGEVYTGLQTNVIDAQENPFSLIESSKLYEVQEYLVLTNHLYGYVMLAMSDLTYNKLTEEQQKAVEEAAAEATEFENTLVFELEEELFDELKESGIEVIEIDNVNEFKEVVLPVHEKFAKEYDEDLYKRIVETE